MTRTEIGMTMLVGKGVEPTAEETGVRDEKERDR